MDDFLGQISLQGWISIVAMLAALIAEALANPKRWFVLTVLAIGVVATFALGFLDMKAQASAERVESARFGALTSQGAQMSSGVAKVEQRALAVGAELEEAHARLRQVQAVADTLRSDNTTLIRQNADLRVDVVNLRQQLLTMEGQISRDSSEFKTAQAAFAKAQREQTKAAVYAARQAHCETTIKRYDGGYTETPADPNVITEGRCFHGRYYPPGE